MVAAAGLFCCEGLLGGGNDVSRFGDGDWRAKAWIGGSKE